MLCGENDRNRQVRKELEFLLPKNKGKQQVVVILEQATFACMLLIVCMNQLYRFIPPLKNISHIILLTS